MLAFPYQHKGVQINQMILSFGGNTGDYNLTAACQKYDGISDASTFGALRNPEFETCAGSLGLDAYVFGANQNKPVLENGSVIDTPRTNKIEKFSGASFTMSITNYSASSKRCRGSSTTLNNSVFVFGGDGNYNSLDNAIGSPFGFPRAKALRTLDFVDYFNDSADKVGLAMRNPEAFFAKVSESGYSIVQRCGYIITSQIPESALSTDPYFLNGWYVTQKLYTTSTSPNVQYDENGAYIVLYFRTVPVNAPPPSSFDALIVPNSNAPDVSSSLEKFNGTSISTVEIHGSEFCHDTTAVSYNGKAYVIGGSVLTMYPLLTTQGSSPYDTSFPYAYQYLNTENQYGIGYFNSIKEFDGSTTITVVKNLIYKTSRARSGELNGNIYIFGGRNRTTQSNNSQKFVPSTNTVTTSSAAAVSYLDGNCDKMGTKLYLHGGTRSGGAFSGVISSFNEVAISSTAHSAIAAAGKSSCTISK